MGGDVRTPEGASACASCWRSFRQRGLQGEGRDASRFGRGATVIALFAALAPCPVDGREGGAAPGAYTAAYQPQVSTRSGCGVNWTRTNEPGERAGRRPRQALNAYLRGVLCATVGCGPVQGDARLCAHAGIQRQHGAQWGDADLHRVAAADAQRGRTGIGAGP